MPGARACTDHDGGRRGKSECAGARDDEHGDGVEHRRIQRGLRTELPPCEEGKCGDSEHTRNEVSRHGVGEPLHGCAGTLRLLHHPDDLRDGRCASDFGRFDGDAPRRVHGTSEHHVARLLFDGDALAGEHGLVDGGRSFGHDAIHGDALARTYRDGVAGDDVTCGYVPLLAVPRDAGGLRLHADERSDGVRRAALRSGLQQPAEEDESDDDGRGVEVCLAVPDGAP